MSLLRSAFNTLKPSIWGQWTTTTTRASLSTSMHKYNESPTSAAQSEPAILVVPSAEQLQALRDLNDDPHGIYDYYDHDALCVEKRAPQPDAGFKL